MQKLKLKHFLLAASLSLGAQATQAASLGALTVLSNIGQPLHAEIDIIPASEQELASLSAKLASAAVFAEQGVSMSPELSALQLHLDTRPDGTPVLRLSTMEAVSSSALEVLIDLNWDTGSLVKKYAVPLEAEPAEDAEADVALPALTEELPYQALTQEEIEADRQTVEEAVAEPLGALEEAIPMEPVAEEAPVAEVGSSIEPAVDTNAAARADYTVERGDTLRNIAVQKSVNGASLEQLMAGLYRANPHAFVNGNMNRLKTGVILHTPSANELKAIQQLEAEREVHLHAKNWNGYRNKLADAVAKASPGKDEQTASPSVSGKIDSVQDQAVASGPRDVVKLSGADADKTGHASDTQNKAQLEEELIARDKALQESTERIAMLEKQLQDANKLLELRKAVAVPPVVAPTKPVVAPAADKGWLTTAQTQLQQHPSWAPIGGIAAFALLILVLLVRFFRKKEDEPAATDISAVANADIVPARVEPVVDVMPAPAPEPVLPEPVQEAPPVAWEPVVESAPSPAMEFEPVPVFGSDAVLDIDDIAALMPEPAPELPEEEAPVAAPAEPEAALPASAVESEDAMALIAAMEAASAASAQEPVAEVKEGIAPEVEVAEPPAETVADVEDIFASEAALTEWAAEMPESPAPVTETVAAEAVAEPEVIATPEADAFDIDDVFAEAAPEVALQAEPEIASPPATEPEPTPPAEAAADIEDIFDSEAALAAFAAELGEPPVMTEEAVVAAAMADEAATDVMAMESGEVEAETEEQFALDSVFDEVATAAEPAIEAEAAIEDMTAAAPEAPVAAAQEEPAAKTSDDHSEALAAAFDESAVADLNDLDFGFDIDLGDMVPKAPVKPVVTEKVAALDLSNISLNVAGDAATGDAGTTNAEPPEVDTKLDLVTAYIDMSDEDGARELLQEVLKEGGPNQIAKAQKMLEDLG